MTLQLAPPRDLAWNTDLSFACNGDANTVAGVYPISTRDPWMSVTFPDGIGTQDVVLDMFDIPYKKLLGAEGVSVSYSSKLTLERKDPK